MSIAEVQARIADIASRFSAPIAASSAVSAAASSGADFSTALAAAVGELPSTQSAGGASETGGAGINGDAVVAAARRYLGIPYLWGGTDPKRGLDCSGLVQRVYTDLGISLPRVSQDQARVGRPVPSLAQAQPGDLIAFGNPADYIGIYIGNNSMIVARHTGDVVKVQTTTRPVSAIRRVLPDATPAAAARLARPALFATSTARPATATTAAGIAGPARFTGLFAAAGARDGVPPQLLSAVARAESDYNPTKVSSAGARGLMQIMPGTARDLGIDPMDPAQAIDGAARLLSGYLRQYGSIPLALAAYDAGPGAVARYGGVPPYAETQAYVRRVQSFMNGAAA